jgi:signal peptidase I
MKKIIPNIDALEIIEEGLKSGSSVRITVRGSSMSPLLLDGVDVVTLKPFIHEELKVGDVILFRYREVFVLHRIVDIQGYSAHGGKIITKGDALEQREEIDFSDVVAVAEVPKIGLIKLSLRRGRIFINRILLHFSRLLK